jgi:hypothetical protein
MASHQRSSAPSEAPMQMAMIETYKARSSIAGTSAHEPTRPSPDCP